MLKLHILLYTELLLLRLGRCSQKDDEKGGEDSAISPLRSGHLGRKRSKRQVSKTKKMHKQAKHKGSTSQPSLRRAYISHGRSSMDMDKEYIPSSESESSGASETSGGQQDIE